MKKIIFLLTGSLFLFSLSIAQVHGAYGINKKNPSPLNGSTTLGMTYNHSECGLNYVHASSLVETRYNQYALPQNIGTGLPTTLAIAGLPNGSTILQAYLWYNVSYQEASPPATTVSITNTMPSTSTIPATNIGQDQDKCWGETGTVNYRADVTAAISGNGNYVVNITGLTNPNWEVDGVELFIIYKDNMATYQGSLVIWDGCITQIGTASTQTMTGINACAAGVNGKAFTLSSDHQDNVGGNIHSTTLNGVAVNFSNDMWNFDVDSSSVTAGQTTSSFGMDGSSSGYDCYDWSVMGLYYQTTTCATCGCTTGNLLVSATSSSTDCTGGGGTATATVFCGTAPYTYAWSTTPQQTTQTATGLPIGTYTVTVTDTNAVTATAVVTVNNTPFTTTTSVTSVTCFGGIDGSATIHVSGGTVPYTYLWNPTGQTTQTNTGLSTGTYSVIVTDSSGICMDTFSVTVPGIPQIVLNLATTPSSCSSCFDGSVSSIVNGGTPPYTYNWNTGLTTSSITGLSTGNYTLCITDANNCTICNTTSIFVVGVNELSQEIPVNIYPNPSNGEFTVYVFAEGFPSGQFMVGVEIKITNLLGETILQKTVNKKQEILNLKDAPAGIYFLNVKTLKGTVVKKIVKE